MPFASAEAKREYQRNWVARRKSDYLADKSCVRCGTVELLRLDHIDPKLKVNHRIWSWSTTRREQELAKCQVLCEPCHKIKTATDLDQLQHGHPSMYRNQGCRCIPCTAAHAEAQRRWRAK